MKKILEIEKETNHDIKAIEYYMRTLCNKYTSFIHIGLTSEDINSLSRSLMIRGATNFILNNIDILIHKIDDLSENWNIPMLAKTHGQSATPTILGKEFGVYTLRLENQFQDIKYRTKFGGATGDFNAMRMAYLDIDWTTELNNFIERFNLERNDYTTQIDHYDNFAEVFDMSQDIWLYIYQ
jgi:adenylosuccinate lyase